MKAAKKRGIGFLLGVSFFVAVTVHWFVGFVFACFFVGIYHFSGVDD